jgi:1-acyl-sn-glycerol-3-phosphate acyltransferase
MKLSLYWIIWNIVRLAFRLLFGLTQVHYERLPKEGPIIVAANHQSNFDPPLLAVSIGREMHFFAKKELFGVFFLGWVIRKCNSIPVRRGIYDPVSLNRAMEALAGEGGLIMFPEGTRGDGITFLRPKPGVGLIAKKTRAAIVPAYIYRSNRLWRALFGRGRVRVLFGEPIAPDEVERFDDSKEGYRSLAEFVMERIGQLKLEAVSSQAL